MGAADEIRAGKLAQYAALQDAGLNTHAVEVFILLSKTGSKEIVGKQGERRYNRLTISPTPEVTLNRREIPTENGFLTTSDAQLKGPFPPSLAGREVLINEAGDETASTPTTKAYADARVFRVEIEQADYFLIDGERYKFRGGGLLSVDKYESEWSIKLLKAQKANDV